MAVIRQVYVISDVHLGGVYPQGRGDRGFRMMTQPEALAAFIRQLAARPAPPQVELVINGDFLDFLAEEHQTPDRWVPFLYDGKEAAATLRQILDRPQDRQVFDSLGELLRRGHALTLLLGNHDLELSLPEARAAFEKALGIEGRHSYRFIYDGEGYQVGEALIEHGHRYDPINIVDQDGLRRLRSLHSRRQFEYQEGHFSPSGGSRLVTEVMNPIKIHYGFIDLLKPESKPLFALLLAIEPSYRQKIAGAARALAAVPRHLMAEPALPSYQGDIAARETSAHTSYMADISAEETDDVSKLRRIIAETVGEEMAGELLPPVDYQQDIAFGIDAANIGLMELFLAGGFVGNERRLRWFRKTLSALLNDHTFDDAVEPSTGYLEAATELSRNSQRYRYIIFGHTHHAKDVQLPGGARYLNTGTWANLMRFPPELLADDETRALAAARSFFEDLRHNRLDAYLEFRPTYARLDVNEEGRVVEADLHTFNA